jgi:hypothetical protein
MSITTYLCVQHTHIVVIKEKVAKLVNVIAGWEGDIRRGNLSEGGW